MNLLFDFSLNKEAKTINITREFAASLDVVWDAFTKAEILDQWIAPKPLRAQTKVMDFRVGGRWQYAMLSAESVVGWALAEYIAIEIGVNYTTRNCFCDEDGKQLNAAFSITTNTFKEAAGITTVYIVKQFDDLATIEMMATNGFKEGTEMAYKNLDEYLQKMAANK